MLKKLFMRCFSFDHHFKHLEEKLEKKISTEINERLKYMNQNIDKIYTPKY